MATNPFQTIASAAFCYYTLLACSCITLITEDFGDEQAHFGVNPCPSPVTGRQQIACTALAANCPGDF